jgi:hypothetical protein
MSIEPPEEPEDEDEEDEEESVSRLWTASVTSAISFFRSKPLRISLSPSSSLSSCLRMNVLGLRSSNSKSLNSGPSSSPDVRLGALRELADLADGAGDVLDHLRELFRTEDEHGEDNERHQLERSYVIEHLKLLAMSSVLALGILPWSGPGPRYPSIPSVRNCPGASGFVYTTSFPGCSPLSTDFGPLL